MITELFPVSGIDSLGRKISVESEKANNKEVGLFYFLWNGEHCDIGKANVKNVSEILKNDPQAGLKPHDPIWGDENTVFYWGKPAFGYYLSRDPFVISRHVQMFIDAKIDFLLFDATNAFTYPDVVYTLLDILQDAKDKGYKVPKIAYFTNSYAGDTAKRLYNEVYAKNRNPDLWYLIDGKPLLVGHSKEYDENILNFFTVREAQWPTEELVENGFPWISWERPQEKLFDSNGNNSVISVSCAQHPQILMGDSAMYGEKGNWGRSYHNNDHNIATDSSKYGYNFEEQWDMAIRQDPDIIFITAWNEWTMSKFDGPKDRPVRFVDNADEEYSRDIEPMEGGHGDNYYLQMINNIRRFKGYGIDKFTIPYCDSDPFKDISVWDKINGQKVFIPYESNRDFPGYGKEYFYEQSVCNRFKEIKLLKDDLNIYFYSETIDPINFHINGECLVLSMLTDEKEIIVSYNGVNIEGNIDIADIKCKCFDNILIFTVPRKIICSTEFMFQLRDSLVSLKDSADYYRYGCCAPIGGLRYIVNQK